MMASDGRERTLVRVVALLACVASRPFSLPPLLCSGLELGWLAVVVVCVYMYVCVCTVHTLLHGARRRCGCGDGGYVSDDDGRAGAAASV